MTIITRQLDRYDLKGSPEEILSLLSRLIEAGLAFDYELQGWQGAGHIERKAFLSITALDDVTEVTLGLILA